MPAGSPEMASLVARQLSATVRPPGPRDGKRARSCAATPDTCGAAIEVPTPKAQER